MQFEREERDADSLSDALGLLGMDRMIRRAYEIATAQCPQTVQAWHDAELAAARRERHAKQA